jgi:hypothetical protein
MSLRMCFQTIRQRWENTTRRLTIHIGWNSARYPNRSLAARRLRWCFSASTRVSMTEILSYMRFPAFKPCCAITTDRARRLSRSYFLDPAFQSPGREWWENKLRPLLRIFTREVLARTILGVEFFPYHLRRFRHARVELSSQEYGFRLVRSAVVRGAVVLIMRARSLWVTKVPELETYAHAYTLNSVQNVVVSPRNCAEFEGVVAAIRERLGRG